MAKYTAKYKVGDYLCRDRNALTGVLTIILIKAVNLSAGVYTYDVLEAIDGPGYLTYVVDIYSVERHYRPYNRTCYYNRIWKNMNV